MVSYDERLWCCDTITTFRGVALSFAIALFNNELRTSVLNTLRRESREQKTAFPTECCHHWPAECSCVGYHQVLAQRMKETKLAKNYIVSSFLKHQFDTSLYINFPWEEERIHLFCPWFNNVPSGFPARSLTKHYVLWKKEIIVLIKKYLNTSNLVSKTI